jgi:hypothetical protein
MEDYLQGCSWNMAWNMATRMLKEIWHPAEEIGCLLVHLHWICRTQFRGMTFHCSLLQCDILFSLPTIRSWISSNDIQMRNFFLMLNSVSDSLTVNPTPSLPSANQHCGKIGGGIYRNSSDCLFFPFNICWTQKEPTRGNWLPENQKKNRKPKVKGGENNVCF